MLLAALLLAIGAVEVGLARDARAITAKEGASDSLRVLFVGNSFTYFNDMPRVFETIAESAGGFAVRTELVAQGGATLKDHWDAGKALNAIRRGRWDFVVLQDQSTFGDTYLVNGRFRVHSTTELEQSGRLFADAVHASGAKPVFLSHWADRDAPARDDTAIAYAYTRIAKELHAILIPVGLAWDAVRAEAPSIELYDADHHHPSPAGSYVEAASVYSVLTGLSPIGAPARVRGPAVNREDGTVSRDSIVELVDLPGSVVRTLQRVVWRTVSSARRAGGYIRVRKPPPITLPTVEGGEPIRSGSLVGTWSGTSHVYPADRPAATQLQIDHDGDQLRGRLRIMLGSTAAQVHEVPVSVK